MRIQRSASHAGWVVEYHDEFRADLGIESEAVQVAVIAASGFLQQFGPQFGRPHVRHAEGFVSFKYEGITNHIGGRRVADSFCLRSAAEGDPALWRQ